MPAADSLLAPHRASFRAIAESFVPEAAGLPPAGWHQLEHIVEQALAARPASIQRQVLLFVRILDLIARLRYRRALAGLDPGVRRRLLDRIGHGPLLPFRRGVWGLRTLVMMGFYARPEGQAAVGYHASASGWGARR